MSEKDYQRIVFMKYGVHGSENPVDIIKRKQNEIIQEGICFWGYGGSLCHPIKQIHPFVEENYKNGFDTFALMQFTKSKHRGDSKLARYFSIDNSVWKELPKNVNVYSSKYALCFSEIKICAFDLNMNDYMVAAGPSSGCILSEYIRFRVDKACASRRYVNVDNNNVLISLSCKLSPPYAVFIK